MNSFPVIVVCFVSLVSFSQADNLVENLSRRRNELKNLPTVNANETPIVGETPKPNVNLTSALREALKLGEKLQKDLKHDPLPLPDLRDQFEKDDGLLFGLKMKLTNGLAHNNSKVSLASEVIGKFVPNLMASGDLFVPDVTLEYKYSACILGMNNHGKVMMSLKNAILSFAAEYNMLTQENVEVTARLTKFEVLGPRFESEDTSTFLMRNSSVIHKIESYYKWKILDALEEEMSREAKNVADLLNSSSLSLIQAAVEEESLRKV